MEKGAAYTQVNTVKLQDVAKCASFLRIRIEFHLFQLLSCLDYVLVKFVLVLWIILTVNNVKFC